MESVRDLIEKRAYELFLARGGLHGYHMQDWEQAQKDVLAKMEKAPTREAIVKPSQAPAAPAAPAKEIAAKQSPAPATAAPAHVAPVKEPVVKEEKPSSPAPAPTVPAKETAIKQAPAPEVAHAPIAGKKKIHTKKK